MPKVKFTPNLKRFFPDLTPFDTKTRDIAQILIELEQKYPGIKGYIVDDQNQLRQHVQIFIGNEMISDRKGLSDEVEENGEIYIMQALSGG